MSLYASSGAISETDYSAQSARTITEPFGHLDKIPLFNFQEALFEVSKSGKQMDLFKKALVYGRDVPLASFRNVPGADINRVPIEVLHGVIGIITESCELADFLLAIIYGGDEFDEINLREELGDIEWYAYRICRRMGWHPGDIRASNIAKLFLRHKVTGDEGANFNHDAHDHANRSIAQERDAIEQAAVERTKEVQSKKLFNERVLEALTHAVNFHGWDSQTSMYDHLLARVLWADMSLYLEPKLAHGSYTFAYQNHDLEHALEHALEASGVIAGLNLTEPYAAAAKLMPEVWKHLNGATDVQVYEAMTPEERAKIGSENA